MLLRNSVSLLICSLILTACSKPEPVPAPSTTDENVILPPAWAFGVLYGGYTNQEQTIDRIKEIQKHNYPIDAYWIDSWFWSFDDQGEGPDKYLDFVADTIAFPDRKAMWSFMEQNNIKGGFWTWDAIQKTGNESAFEDFESRGYFKDTYMNTNPWHNKSTTTAMFQSGSDKEGTLTGNIDFENPEAAAYFKTRMKHFFDEGADFVKLDRTTQLATMKTIFEMSQEFGLETKGRGFMLSHAAETDDPEFKRYPTKWTSDTRSDWTIDDPRKDFNSWVPNVAFKENIEKYTDPENPAQKVPFLTNDTGGFDKGLTDELDEELYIRWVQFSAFTPIMEVFSQPENPTSNLAYNYSPLSDSIFRAYTHLRMELFPYIYSYAHQTRWTGKNMIMPLPGKLYEYEFGNELLITPVYEFGALQRDFELPGGRWYEYWSHEPFWGPGKKSVNLLFDNIPVFVKAGSIIPKRDYASSIESGSNDHLTLEVFDGASGQFSLYEDDGSSNDYLEGKYAITEFEYKEGKTKSELIISPAMGLYDDMPEERTYSIELVSERDIAKIRVNGKKIDFETIETGIKTEPIKSSVRKKMVIEFIY